MKAQELRTKYLEFFKTRGHAVIPPASLIPDNDPSLLFVNSGMFPLMPYLSGAPHPMGKRLADVQPSFRSLDIDAVGDQRHDTFFEMLGNWSLGDYWKWEQLFWWYEFLVEVIGLDIQKIYQSVHAGEGAVTKDEESIAVLKEVFEKYGIKNIEEGPETVGQGEKGPGVEITFNTSQRIFAYRDKNWWQRGDAVGELGGPDSETFYDTGKQHDPKFGRYCHLNCDCGRFIEIGNSVFMQYKKTDQGWEPLQQKNIDFGGGLERILMAKDGFSNMFETDAFKSLIVLCERLSGKKYANDPVSFEIIADHIRAAVFLMADGAYPSNKDQGYYVRRLIRRAIRYSDKLGIQEFFLAEFASEVVKLMKDFYTRLPSQEEKIKEELNKEEKKFRRTLTQGLKQFAKCSEAGALSGVQAFDLFSTYGFPLELTQELAKEKNISIDTAGFQEEMKKHQEKSRASLKQKFHGGLADHSEQSTKYHTATHLLHQALRTVLGDHVQQKGSNITAERLRFDFSHPEKMTPEQIQQTEDLVNQQIQRDLPVSFDIVSVEEGKKRGALGFFEERYGDKVKIYKIGDFSLEICGGPHVPHTAVIGKFKITKEEAVSTGIRRIRAIAE